MPPRDYPFPLWLIAAEEARRERVDQAQSPPTPRPEPQPQTVADSDNTFVFEDTDIVTDRAFYVSPPETGISVPGPGSLDSLLVVADSSDFSVAVETGTATLLDHQHTTLKANSAEFSHVAAYQRSDGKEVLSVSDYEYRDQVVVQLAPTSQVTFDRIRATYTVESGVVIGD